MITMGKRSVVRTPPIKCQGIKTKLVPFILSSIRWSQGESGRWIEPFLGSGVVAFNLAPRRAILADINPHIIRFYRAIQNGSITPADVQQHLFREGRLLEARGEAHYYAVRKRFNHMADPLDFLFLNRAGFNGLIRFNQEAQYNVPFCKKPGRFSPAYITKIVNQVRWVSLQMQGKAWEFRVASWEEILDLARPEDFVYLDPPYEGRHTDYYNQWTTEQTERLVARMLQLPCGYALSMWLENEYRRNLLVDYLSKHLVIRVYQHFYHIGAEEVNRRWIREALLIHPDYVAEETATLAHPKPAALHHDIHPADSEPVQMSLFDASIERQCDISTQEPIVGI
ncbi:MAG: DNA adenine methylase [Armatimonadetes bacterium JP3_11]|jgi:DNA adenine methylase|nr:MAG: DNA adenine methylase [Armatimonadetes bacterium JP3_11]RMH09226.1 MAG: Dam family site-specific DNA-(adenine-N6)-methyltransferase [Armatimonadota bacterium]